MVTMSLCPCGYSGGSIMVKRPLPEDRGPSLRLSSPPPALSLSRAAPHTLSCLLLTQISHSLKCESSGHSVSPPPPRSQETTERMNDGISTSRSIRGEQPSWLGKLSPVSLVVCCCLHPSQDPEHRAAGVFPPGAEVKLDLSSRSQPVCLSQPECVALFVLGGLFPAHPSLLFPLPD